MKANLYFLALAILLLYSCAATKSTRLLVDKNDCNQRDDFHYAPAYIIKPIRTADVDTTLSNSLSFNSINIANAIGVLDLLKDYIAGVKKNR